MIAEIAHKGRTFKVDLGSPIDLAFPLHAGEDQLRAWWIDPVTMEPVRYGDTTYAVKDGAPVNFRTIRFNTGTAPTPRAWDISRQRCIPWATC
ncbi:MAG: hypothetical protein MUE88_10145 [Flavobacteriales bacterium]|nr:hypothetical protein [Flavobacteriales bacterium]